MVSDRPGRSTRLIDPSMRVWRTADEAGTEAVGEALAAELAPDGILLLSGDLGSGKTVLARGIARGLGIDPREVQSPTYTLIREHGGRERGRLIHVDLYRLEPADLDDLGLDELLAGPGVKVVEWAERLPAAMGPATGPEVRALALEIRRAPGGGREIRQI